MIGNLIILAVLGAFAVVLAYATYLSAREWSVLCILNQHGIEIRAKVDDVRRDTQGRGEYHYIHYRFYVDGISYENKQQISKRHYKQYLQSKEVNIRYLVSKPSVSRLAGSDFDNTSRNVVSYIELNETYRAKR